MYPVIVCSVLLPFGIVLIYFVELFGNRNVLAPQGVSPEALSADELQAIPRRLIGPDTGRQATEIHPKLDKSASGSLRASFRAVLRHENETGVTRAELVAEFERRVADAGEDSAVEWLQIAVRTEKECILFQYPVNFSFHFFPIFSTR